MVDIMHFVMFCLCCWLIDIDRFLIVQLMNEQDAQPRTVIALWKTNLEEPKLHQSDPSVIIQDTSTSNFSLLTFSLRDVWFDVTYMS